MNGLAHSQIIRKTFRNCLKKVYSVKLNVVVWHMFLQMLGEWVFSKE